MLAYLESLCSALKARDAGLISELLRHPLASALPSAVLEEAQAIATRHDADHAAPINALRLYHQTAHLLGACTDPASRRRQGAVTSAPSVGGALDGSVMRAASALSALDDRSRQIQLDLPLRAAAVA